MMNKYGGVATSGITCQSFTLDYENGEYVTSVDFSYDTSAIRGIRATSNLGTTLQKGKFFTSHTKDTLTFDETNQLVALWGTSTTGFFQGLGAITVDTTCVAGTEIEEPSSTTEEAEVSVLGLIIGLVVAGVVTIAILIAVTAFCCYKKRQHNKM
jgi:hypothetical protein